MLRIKVHIEKFWYEQVIKKLLSISKLGRTSINGCADSGLNFDHMYENSPEGITLFGKFVDNVLLNLPSVKATRHRREIIIKILNNEISNNLLLNKKTRILDLASGPARYLIDILSNYDQEHIEVLCLDQDVESLNFGKILAKNMPIRYMKADVGKTRHIKRLSRSSKWIPNIVLISGLFEYKDDFFVKKVIKDVYQGIDKNGLFIFVNQADNPSKKLMSKVCKTSEGKSWELVYRSPGIFRSWLISAGFRGVMLSLDKWGMYEFCTCRR